MRRVLTLLCLLFVGGCGSGASSDVDATPVYIVPVGPVAREIVDAARREVARVDSTLIGQLPGEVALEPSMREGSQLVAERAIARLRRFAAREGLEPYAAVIGITAADMRIQGIPEWRWAFSWRDARFAVVSTARMGRSSAGKGRAAKAVARNVAFLTLRAPKTSDRSCVNGPAPMSMDELDALGVRVCR